MSDAESAPYDWDELNAIVCEFSEHGSAHCPRCAVPLSRRRVGGGSFGLGYARRREWLICPRCWTSALFDLKRGTRN